jgi:gluconokinase
MDSSPASTPSCPDVVVVMGVAGSGKTVVGRLLASHLGYEFFDADDFHPPENVALMRQGIPLDDEKRRPWLDRLACLIDTAIGERRGMVLACSALKRSYRDRLGTGKPHVRLVHLDGTEQLLRERLEQRTGHFMPASLLASQCALLERPSDDERPIRVDISSSPETIVREITAAVGRA